MLDAVAIDDPQQPAPAVTVGAAGVGDDVQNRAHARPAYLGFAVSALDLDQPVKPWLERLAALRVAVLLVSQPERQLLREQRPMRGGGLEQRPQVARGDALGRRVGQVPAFGPACRHLDHPH